MPNELQQIILAPQPEIEDFVVFRVASQFYREVELRENTQRYCDWYYATAKSHRQELQRMRGELNIWSWFRSQGVRNH